MRDVLEPGSWSSNIAAFDRRNKMRPTRLEVLGASREFDSDYWIEDGLLLSGIDFELNRDRNPEVQIMLQSRSAKAHLTHSVSEVKHLSLQTALGKDECLEIEDSDGNLTIMRFEHNGND